MISEVINSLFLTYLASEYLVSESRSIGRRLDRPLFSAVLEFVHGRFLYIAAGLIIVLFVNILDHVSGMKHSAKALLEKFFHLPKIIFAALAYVTSLYYDIHRRAPLLCLSAFLSKVGWAFLRVLPVYPFLAVMISFVFLFVINIWEALALPMEWLNAPIYYGTLYGPCAWVYVKVKQQVIGEYSSLPL